MGGPAGSELCISIAERRVNQGSLGDICDMVSCIDPAKERWDKRSLQNDLIKAIKIWICGSIRERIRGKEQGGAQFSRDLEEVKKVESGHQYTGRLGSTEEK